MKDFIIPDYNESLGGCLSFDFAPLQYLSSIPEPSEGIITSPITMASGMTFIKGSASAGSLSFTETAKQTPSGLLYSVEFKAFYAGRDVSMSFLMESMAKFKFVLLVTDLEGVTRMIGSIKEPLSFAYAFATMANAAERKGFQLTFSGFLTSHSPVYSPNT